MNNVGKNIMTARKQAGLTQEELAKRVGYKTKSAINKIEMGLRDIPQKKIKQFAEALGTTPGLLMGWVDEETNKNNDIISDVVVRMRTDEEFLSVVEAVYKLDGEKLSSLLAFLK